MEGYEVIIITDPDLSEEELNSTLDKVKATIATHSGEVVKYHLWGRRRLAYLINKKTHGVYHMFYISGGQEMLTALDQQYRFNDEFIRTQTIKVNSIDEEIKRFFELIKEPSSEETNKGHNTEQEKVKETTEGEGA